MNTVNEKVQVLGHVFGWLPWTIAIAISFQCLHKFVIYIHLFGAVHLIGIALFPLVRVAYVVRK